MYFSFASVSYHGQKSSASCNEIFIQAIPNICKDLKKTKILSIYFPPKAVLLRSDWNGNVPLVVKWFQNKNLIVEHIVQAILYKKKDFLLTLKHSSYYS